MLHIHVLLVAPLGTCRMAKPRIEQHQGGFHDSVVQSHCCCGCESSDRRESYSMLCTLSQFSSTGDQLVAVSRGDSYAWLCVDVVLASQPCGNGILIRAADIDALDRFQRCIQFCLTFRLCLAEDILDDAFASHVGLESKL